MPEITLHHRDNLEWLKSQPDDSVDLVFTSPPYESARTYGVGFNLNGQKFVDWCFSRYIECLRVCRGLVAWVIEGRTKRFRYTATPALLMADLHRAGVHLRKPPAFHRIGIPGSGGPDWLRNDWEWIICATSGGKLPWSDNTAMGHAPKYGTGGACSNRNEDGTRRSNGIATRGSKNGDTKTESFYAKPDIANPGNVIHAAVGGGVMGSPLSHENEAPFPQKLAEFFVRSFCPPGGTVLDIHSGSGTTGAAALQCSRNYIGIDFRRSQIDLTRRRLQEVQPELF